jgi:transcription elongation factor GreA
MSKAFTREDDAGLEPPQTPKPRARPPLTPMGAQLLQAERDRALQEGDGGRVEAIEARLASGVIPPPEDPGIVALGAEVTLRDARGQERVMRIVTPDEVGMVPGGASAASPLARALVGAREGASVEIGGPFAERELVIVKIAWPV